MTVTAASLKAAHPEFSDASDLLVTSMIALAAAQVSSATWGDLYDQGVDLLACHKLALSPDGRAMRLDPEGRAGHYGLGLSVYGQEFEAMKRAVCVGLGRVA